MLSNMKIVIFEMLRPFSPGILYSETLKTPISEFLIFKIYETSVSKMSFFSFYIIYRHHNVVNFVFIHAERGTEKHVLNNLFCVFLRKYDCKIRQNLQFTSKVILREKGKYLTQSYNKSPFTHRQIQNAT